MWRVPSSERSFLAEFDLTSALWPRFSVEPFCSIYTAMACGGPSCAHYAPEPFSAAMRRPASIRRFANGSAASTYRMADWTFFQPTYSIRVLRSHPLEVAQLAKPRRKECPLYRSADAMPAPIKMVRKSGIRLSGCKPLSLTCPHRSMPRNTGPSVRCAAEIHVT